MLAGSKTLDSALLALTGLSMWILAMTIGAWPASRQTAGRLSLTGRGCFVAVPGCSLCLSLSAEANFRRCVHFCTSMSTGLHSF